VIRARTVAYAPIVVLVLATATAATVSVVTAPSVPAARVWHDPELPPTPMSSDRNGEAATFAARLLLGLETPARSWKPVSSPPTVSLAAPMSEPASADLVDLYQMWTTPGSFRAVQEWVSAHRPAASHPAGSGSSFQSGALVSTDLTYGYPPVAGRLESRQLLVALAPLSRNRVGIRIDAQVIWYPSRPVAEEIPQGVTTVTVTVYSQDNGSGSPRIVLGATIITSPPLVRLLAHSVDSSPLTVPGSRSCPSDSGANPRLDLVFSGRPAVSTVIVHDDTNGCGGISFSIDGRAQAPLTDDGLFHRVDQLLGLDLPRVDAAA